jgi:signal transduction histidine kinase/PAS domain-containing protein
MTDESARRPTHRRTPAPVASRNTSVAQPSSAPATPATPATPAAPSPVITPPATTSAPRARAARRVTSAPAAAPSADSLAHRPPASARHAPSRTRPRESNIAGLGERARIEYEPRLPAALPDPLAILLPGLRQALLNRPFDEAAPLVAEGLAAALAPAAVQIWIADPVPGGDDEATRPGGQELLPTLRPRATARALTRTAPDPRLLSPTAIPAGPVTMSAPALSSSTHQAYGSPALPSIPARPGPLLADVAAARKPLVLFDAAGHPLAAGWPELLAIPSSATTDPSNPSAPSDLDPAASPLGTLAAFPLRARGQLLGVLAAATSARLGPRHLSVLEELCDLAALAADRDRELRYSRSHEALAQTVVRHTPVAVAVLSGPDQIIALANPAFGPLLGLSSDAHLIGRPLPEVVPDRAARLAAALRLNAVYTGGEPQAMIELPIHQQERGLTYWNVTTSPLLGPNGVGGVLVAAVDVTRQVIARQRAQEVAELAQERIGQMMTLHATSLAVASQLGADPRELLADILRRSIALLSARAGTVYARDPRHDDLEVIVCEGLRGDYTGARIRVGEGLPGRVAATAQGLIVDDYRAYPFRAAIYDDEAFSAVIAVPLIHHGQVVGVLDVLDDAERRAFTDDDLWLLDLFAAQAAQAIENARTYVELERAYQKQRELDRLKDDFIATASHELRTPLTGVQGFLDLLLDFPGSRDSELALDFLRKSSDSAQELAEIAERLLQTSRLNSGRIELHAGPVRLAGVVDDVLRSFRELGQAQGGAHELLADIPPDIYLHADLGRLKEVLDNLVGNAIKYSPQGGLVLVRCHPVALSSEEIAPGAPGLFTLPGGPSAPSAGESGAIEERPTLELPHLLAGALDPENDPSAPLPAITAAASQRRYYAVTISDEGLGIPDAERSRLFGRFSRTDSARISQIRGTGLGLYICRQLVRAMDGDIWLHASAPEHGSVFAFALPGATGPLADSGELPALTSHPLTAP